MDAAKVADIERIARNVASATQAARRLDDSDAEVRARSRAADAVLWAVAAWRASRGPTEASYRARRVVITWRALRSLLGPQVDGTAATGPFRTLERCDDSRLTAENDHTTA